MIRASSLDESLVLQVWDEDALKDDFMGEANLGSIQDLVHSCSNAAKRGDIMRFEDKLAPREGHDHESAQGSLHVQVQQLSPFAHEWYPTSHPAHTDSDSCSSSDSESSLSDSDEHILPSKRSNWESKLNITDVCTELALCRVSECISSHTPSPEPHSDTDQDSLRADPASAEPTIEVQEPLPAQQSVALDSAKVHPASPDPTIEVQKPLSARQSVALESQQQQSQARSDRENLEVYTKLLNSAYGRGDQAVYSWM